MLVLFSESSAQSEGTVCLAYGPIDTAGIVDQQLFQSTPVASLKEGTDCLAFTVQIPKHVNITEGKKCPVLLL